MIEQLVTFTTAKLAKEKGFNEFSFSIYDNGGNLTTDYSEYSPNMRYYNDKMTPSKENPDWWLSEGCTAPTQSLLQKWLREKHNIHLSIDNNNYEKIGNWCFDIHNLPTTIKYLWARGDKTYGSYEEALEKGLQEALTEKARGEKLVAQTKAREEAAKLEAVIRAEKEAAVAAENLKRDKLRAQSDLAIKRANAEGDRLKVQAGLTPLEKATIEKETRIGVAKALAGPQGIKFPEIVAGGGNGGGSNGALQVFELERLYELSAKMGSKN